MTIDNPFKSPESCLPERPEADPSEGFVHPAGFRSNWSDYSPEFNAAIKTALLLQAVFAVLTAAVLDFGQTHRAFWVAFLCQWAMVWMILFRRPLRPTRFDLAFVRYGIVPLLLIVVTAGPWLLRLFGIQT